MATKITTPKIDPAFVPGSTVPSATAVKALVEGYSWTATTGQAKNVTYSFSQSTGTSDSDLNGGQATLDSTQQGEVRAALQQWANVANVTFSETTGTADINVRLANMPSGVAGWMAPSTTSQTQLSHADVVMDHAYSDMSTGTYAYMAIMHELGHALGLKHPGNYNGGSGGGTGPFLPKATDSHDLTIMSYYDGKYTNSWNHNPETPMIYDIAAMQFLYGANHSYNSGNTTYSFDGSSHVETIWDGAGTDAISAASTSSNNVIDLREGISNVTTIGQTNLWVAFGANIENGVGGSGNDTIYGNNLNNVLSGGSGNDTLLGSLGNDTIDGEAGSNSVDGGAGNDAITVTGTDTVLGGDGNDTINGGGTSTAQRFDGGAGNDSITAGSGTDVLFGGAGSDTIAGGAGNNTIDGGNDNDTITAGAGNDSILGGAGNDSITAGEGANTVNGGAGNDTIAVGAGNDSVLGGDGNDTITAGDGANTVNGGGGNDTITVGTGDDSVLGDAGNDSIASGSGNDTVDGGAGNDTIVGGDGTDSLLGGAGNDSVLGDNGNDTIDAGAGDDTVYGGANDDSIIGGAGADKLYGDDGNDTLDGGAGNDLFLGGNGDDFCFGGAGNDTYTGGAGNDVFTFFTGGGFDTVTDFQNGDVIEVSSGLFGSVEALLAAIQYTNGNAVLGILDGKGKLTTSITLTGVSSGLDASDFTLV